MRAMSITITVGKARIFPLVANVAGGGTDTTVPATVTLSPATPGIVARINPNNPRELGVYATAVANGNGNGVGVIVSIGGSSAQIVVQGVAPPPPIITSVSIGTDGGEVDPPAYLTA